MPTLNRFVLFALAAVATAAPVPAAPAPQFTPVLLSAFTPPRWFTGDDGKVHLVYELFLDNAVALDATVTRLDVLDASNGKVIASLSGERLSEATSLRSKGSTPATKLTASEAGAIWLDLPFDSAQSIPDKLEHRLTATIPPGTPIATSTLSTAAAVTVDRRPPVILGPPLAGDRWVAVGSCCDGPHRRALQPIDNKLYLSQRFAIDFNRLDGANRFSSGDPARNASYPTYGAPVLAVADARVAQAVDAYQDQVPGQTVGITLANADGNFITLDLGGGRFAFYAHLKPGSVRVKPGETVRRGQQIAESGNTGSSDGPHLHFHVMDGPSPLASDGLPYAFDSFELTGRIPPLAEASKYYEAQQPVPIDRGPAGARRNALPLGGAVVRFAPSKPR